MHNRETRIGRDYLEAVFQRATISMNPLFRPNWKDRPSQFKVYSNVERISLLSEPPSWYVPLIDVLTRNTRSLSDNKGLTFEKLSWLLQFAAGVLNQRFSIHWSSSSSEAKKYLSSCYGRGTASGGGYYPTELYLCSGTSSGLLPGLYHYDTAHHALERLYTGNMIQSIHAATFEHPAAVASDQFLLISLNFWKNTFKYGDFAYYLGTQDMGALLASLHILALALHIDLPFLLWYKDEDLNHLLGLETLRESVFALIPLPKTAQKISRADKIERTFHGIGSEFNLSKIRTSSFQRSKQVLSFPRIETIHQATLIDNEALPGQQEAERASCNEIPVVGEKIALPAPLLEQLQADVFTLFQKRQSSFGRFTQQHALSSAELATLLYYGSQVCLPIADLTQNTSIPHCRALMVIINNVEGIERGAYFYDACQHCLWSLQTGDLTLFLQQHYCLQNYNLAETGAVITIVNKPGKILDVYGNRGCRVMNAEAGHIAQTVSLVATALALGCGTVAGFNNTAMNQIFGLQDTDCRSLLFILIGHERQKNAKLDYRLI